jgi:Phage integrase family
LRASEYNALAQRVLAMQSKRYVRRPICFLTPVEIDALISAPDLNTWSGRRDRALAVQTGLRAAELTGLRGENIAFGAGARVQCLGRGRKSRCTPLRKETVAVLRSWLRERQGQASDPVFPTTRGQALGNDGLEYLLNKHLVVVRRHCPSPADNKWFTRLVVAGAIVEAVENLDLSYPQIDAAKKRELAEARAALAREPMTGNAPPFGAAHQCRAARAGIELTPLNFLRRGTGKIFSRTGYFLRGTGKPSLERQNSLLNCLID